MTPSIIIRPAVIGDLENLLRFEQGVISAERPFDITLKADPVKYYDIEELITAAHILLLVAQAGEQIIGSGYARIEPAKPYNRHQLYAYLGFMFVDPAWRGRGINNQILDGLKQWAKSQGILELRLEVYQENEPAIRAYEKAGFAKHMILMRIGLE